MNSNSFDLKDSYPAPEIVPTWKRILAFAMDMILLVVLLQSLVQVLPNAYSDQAKREFNELIMDASLLSKEEQSNFQRTTEFLENSQLSEETFEMLTTMFFCLYFTEHLFFYQRSFFSVDKLWVRLPSVLGPHPPNQTCL